MCRKCDIEARELYLCFCTKTFKYYVFRLCVCSLKYAAVEDKASTVFETSVVAMADTQPVVAQGFDFCLCHVETDPGDHPVVVQGFPLGGCPSSDGWLWE